MSAVFIQTRNGTVSIIRDLTQEEAEKAVDIALDGPRLRAEAAADLKKRRHQRWVAKLFFEGNPHVQQITFRDWDGQTIIRRSSLGGWSSCSPGRMHYCQDSDITRAEVI